MHKIDAMRSTKELFFRVNSARKPKSKNGLILSGRIQKGYLKTGQRVLFSYGLSNVECFVDLIWLNGKQVNECYADKEAIVSVKSNVPFEDIKDLTNIEGWHLCYGNDDSTNKVSKIVETDKLSNIPTIPDKSDSSRSKRNIRERNSKSNLETNRVNLLTKNEKEYIKNLRSAISRYGYLSPTEVYVLDKIRIALGIGAKRAEEIELKYISRIPDDNAEHNYYEAVAACLLDCNYISDSERDLLRNLRDYLRISEARAAEIEKLADWDNYSE